MAGRKRKENDRALRRARARKARQNDLGALHKLESGRLDAEPLPRRIVQGVLDRFVPGDAPRPLEIGCGGGQLRLWLPERLAARALHLDLSDAFVRTFRRRHRDAAAVRASALDLPVVDGSMDAVVALCVLDALPAPERARDQILRALSPGGRFVHFLDLTTNVADLFTSFVEDGLVPMPNFLRNLEAPPGVERSALPQSRPLDDLLVAPRSELGAILGLLTRAGHPLGPPLREYIDLFDPDGWNQEETARAFVTITSDRQAGARLNQALAQLYLTVQSPRWRAALPLSLRPVSSLRPFEARLSSLFSAEQGCATELAAVVSARDTVPRDRATPPACRFLGFWVGTRIRLDEAPEEPVGTPLGAVTRDDLAEDSPTEAPQDDARLTREAAVHVFVVRRLP